MSEGSEGDDLSEAGADPASKIPRSDLSFSEQARTGARLNVSLECVEAFVIAADHISLSEAAHACGVGEDTFRKRLNALEAWAGVALAQRRPDLILTPDGQRFLPLAREACIAMRSFRDNMSSYQKQNVVLGRVPTVKSGSMRRRNTASGFYVEID